MAGQTVKGLYAACFFRLFQSYFTEILKRNYEFYLQIVGAVSLFVLVLKFRKLLFTLAFGAILSALLSFTFEKCVYGCIHCVFERLVEQGICLEIRAKSGFSEHVYYQCDLSIISSDAILKQ